MNTALISNGPDRLWSVIYPHPGKDTIVLLHGGPGYPDDLAPVVRYLAENFQVITFHQRGTGRSPCASGDYSMEAYVSDISAVAAYFQVRKFHLFGHSWGGLYAQLYAQKHPAFLCSLFLCNPALGTGPDWKRTEKEVLRYNRSACTWWEWLGMGGNSLLGMLGNSRAYQRLYRQVWKNYNKGFAVSSGIPIDAGHIRAIPINRTRAAIAEYPLLDEAADPAFPITIVFGDHDIYGKCENFVIRRYPTARVHIIKGCGHFPWLHQEAVFRKVLNEHFL